MLQTDLVFLFHLTLSASAIIFLNAVEGGRIKGLRALAIVPFAPVVVQFSFGGLFSGFVSLYSRSATYIGTWIFIAVLACLMVGNERFRKLYVRFSFQIALYFSALFLFFIFFLPVVLHEISTQMFLLSGLVAVGVASLLLLVLSRVAPVIEKRERTRSARSIAVIWAVVNILYFSNAIPPLPLALKDAGVYHAVAHRADGIYELQGEPRTWLETFLPFETTYHRVSGEGAVVFTSIFAPTGLSTPVLHEWQRYDEVARTWVTKNELSFTINGGRDGGYRGYSRKYGLETGRWRVNVILPSGSIIGRVAFEVIEVATPIQLETTAH